MIRSALGRRASSALFRFALPLIGAVSACTVPLESTSDSSPASDAGAAGAANPRGGKFGQTGAAPPVGGSLSNAGTGGGADTPAASATDTGAVMTVPDRSCSVINVSYQRVTPTIMFVVGASASMAKPLDSTDVAGASRWTALRTTTLDLIRDVQNAARVGVLLVGGPGGAGGDGSTCPNTVRVPPLLNNANAIERAFPTTPWTQPQSAIDNGIQAASSMLFSPTNASSEWLYLVVAIDAEPTTCSTGGGSDGLTSAAAALKTAHQQKGILGGVLAVSNDLLESELSKLTSGLEGAAFGTYRCANGAGCESAAASLTQVFKRCVFRLNNAVNPSQASSAKVTLDGKELVYSGPNGWRFTTTDGAASTQLELLGSACQSLSGADLSIQFPCSAIVRNP